MKRWISALSLLAITCPLLAYEPISLTGSNGTVVAFAGIQKASSQGLTLIVNEGDKPILVPWNRFDLDKLLEHKEIDAAYQTATSGGGTVPLNLGIFADMFDEASLIQYARKRLDKSIQFETPKLSYFFEHKEEEFMSTSFSEDKTAAKRSERFIKEYSALTNEFFQLDANEIKKETITWNWGGDDIFVICTEAHMPKSSVSLTVEDVLQYFGEERMRSHSDAAYYMVGHHKPLSELNNILSDIHLVTENRFMGSSTRQSVMLRAITRVEEHMRTMETSRVIGRDLTRDVQEFLAIFGKPSR